MAITQNTYTGDGSTVLFSFTFEYIAESDIKITLDGTPTTAYTLANATTIQFNTAPANGVEIRIYRDTNIDTLSAEFFPGSAIRAEDLNNNFTQNLYVTQEVSNNAVQSDDSIPFVNDISMGGYKITNLADPVADTDAVNRVYVNNVVANGIGDGDKGDIVVSGSGSTLTIDSGAVTDAKVDGGAAIQSTKLAFIHSGTSATTRTVESKLRDVVSVKDFGAVGDGVTDDTAAIQAAIHYVKTSTSRLTADLGGAAYLISQPLVISEGDCGIANGKLIADPANFASDSSGSEAMIRTKNGLRISIRNIELECNFVANGIHNESNGFFNHYDHLEIIEGKDFGIKLEGNGDQVVSNCLLTQSQSTAAKRTGIGIDIQTGDIKVHNCVVRFWLKNIVINDNTTLISDCHFYNGNSGIDVPMTNTINIQIDGGSGQTITGCYIDKGRLVLNATSNHWSGNRYLFTTISPEHDSVFVFNTTGTNSKFPTDWIHEGNYGTLPVTNGTIPFIELSGTGTWSTEAQAIVADLQTNGAMPETGNAFFINEENGDGHTFMFEKALSSDVKYKLAGATFDVKDSMIESAHRLTSANGLKQKFAALGGLSTAELSVEGSRTGSNGVCSSLKLADRRGSSTLNLSDTDLGYWKVNLRGNTGTNSNFISFVESAPSVGTETEYYRFGINSFKPVPSSSISLGAAGALWSEVYAATATINTSDARLKTFLAIEEAESSAALEIKANLRKFKFNSAIESKGGDARIHFGVSAQQIGEIMTSHGLDPHRYSFFCYDEWEAELDEDGNEISPAGNAYGIRYEELLCFIMAAI